MRVIERHGRVDADPDDAALRAIKILNGAYLKTKRTAIQNYHRATLESLCASGEVIQAQQSR